MKFDRTVKLFLLLMGTALTISTVLTFYFVTITGKYSEVAPITQHFVSNFWAFILLTIFRYASQLGALALWLYGRWKYPEYGKYLVVFGLALIASQWFDSLHDIWVILNG